MVKFNLFKEDLDALSLSLFDTLANNGLVDVNSELKENNLINLLDDVLDKFFDSPEYRNYN